MGTPDDPVRVSSGRFAWLSQETSGWQQRGIIDAETRAQILARYDPESAERRGTLALVLIAVLMCGLGVLLLIGYNWKRIPPEAKVALTLASVAISFAASAIAYARQRPTIGEVLSFVGVVMFANAIWLIAQVLHIQGHFPDAFLWTGIGALACAALVESRWIGVAATIMFAAWIFTETTFAPRPIYAFIVIGAASLVLAYQLRSRVMLSITALVSAGWLAAAVGDTAGRELTALTIAALACAFFATGSRHASTSLWRETWQDAALIVLLVSLVPLMVVGFHRAPSSGELTVVDFALIALVILSAGALSARKPSTPAELAMTGVLGASVVWMLVTVFIGTRLSDEAYARLGTVLFSIAALGVSVALIRTALRSNRVVDLGFGVLFSLAFLMVRWTSVLENLLWSGAVLLLAGGGLLLIARLWRQRDRNVVPRRGLS